MIGRSASEDKGVQGFLSRSAEIHQLLKAGILSAEVINTCQVAELYNFELLSTYLLQKRLTINDVKQLSPREIEILSAPNIELLIFEFRLALHSARLLTDEEFMALRHSHIVHLIQLGQLTVPTAMRLLGHELNILWNRAIHALITRGLLIVADALRLTENEVRNLNLLYEYIPETLRLETARTMPIDEVNKICHIKIKRYIQQGLLEINTARNLSPMQIERLTSHQIYQLIMLKELDMDTVLSATSLTLSAPMPPLTLFPTLSSLRGMSAGESNEGPRPRRRFPS